MHRYLCEVRAGQYRRGGERQILRRILGKTVSGVAARKAYYLMSIHEHLPAQARKELKEVEMDEKGLELAEGGAAGPAALRLCNLVAQSS